MISARLYLVTPAAIDAGAVARLVPELAAAGVDMVQLREKDMEVSDVLRVGQPLADACRAAGVPFIVNDRADVALALHADGVHLGQNDLPVTVARRVLPGGIIGRSTHSRAQIDADVTGADRADYVAVGPVYETPTKPGRPAVGVDLVRYASTEAAVPWFAIGGIDEDNLRDLLEAGARRIVVVRAITSAPDPVDAAARLRKILDEVAV